MNYENEISKHFADRADRYDIYGSWVNNEEVLNAMLNAIPIVTDRGIDIVDLGAGTGAVINYLFVNNLRIRSGYAIDICEEMLQKINTKGVFKCVANLEELPLLDNSFDVALSRQCLHYVKNLNKALNEIYRILRAKGIFVLGQITAFEDEYKEYWSRLMVLRQPLRKHFFSEVDWINVCAENGFKLRATKNIQTKGSINKWIKKYNITDKNRIIEYENMLLNAPLGYKEKYHVIKTDDDIEYSVNWSILSFAREEADESI